MIYAKVQPVVRYCSMILSLLLIFLSFGNHSTLAQCPENVRVDKNSSENSGSGILLVYDAAESSFNISRFEINIFNELTGNYLITESNIIPSIVRGETVEVSKSGNRILISDLDSSIDLTKCLIIFVGGDCPVKKIRIKDN